MFHTLFDSKEDSSDYNILYPKKNKNYYRNKFKLGGPNDNYFGKGNKAIDQYNKKKIEMENDAKFRKTKNKIKLVVYKNGFILNNGPFRDRTILENSEFLAEVEKGFIPQEFIRKGIIELGILLINRRNEMYRSPLYQSLQSSLDYKNGSKKEKRFHNENQQYNQFPESEENSQNDEIKKISPKIGGNYIPQTPIGKRNHRRNFFKNGNSPKNRNKQSKSIEKGDESDKDKKFMTLNDLNRDKNEKKKFIAFSGNGKLLANAKIEGIFVDENIYGNCNYINNNYETIYGFGTSSKSNYEFFF